MPAAPVEVASASSAAPDSVGAIDALLDAVTAIKAQQKQLEQQLEPLLEALNEAMAAGQLDPSFSHNDWAFCHSLGRLSYAFPAAVQQIEQQLKAAKEAAIQQGSATEKRGKPFWTIRPPKAQDQPF
jgi:methyl-accepting chemotaxis protein